MARLQLRIFTGLLTLAVALTPPAAFAQSGPADMPSYANPPSASDQETIHGRIASVDDADSLQINDDRGFVDSVKLQPGASIYPSGTRLQPGMNVTIAGVARGAVFAANRVEIAPDQSVAPQQPQEQPAVPLDRPGPATELTGILGTSLDSKSAFVGEDVELSDVSSADGSINGATLYGSVTDVTRAGQGRSAQVAIHFDSMRLPDGRKRPIDGIVVSMKVQTKSNAAKEVGGALLGMLAGNAIGKTLFGVSGGGVVGALGGYVIAKDNRSDVVIPENTAITVRLVNARRQAS
jgi:hypothetical protein